MEMLTQQQEAEVMIKIAKEFLEYRLGVEPSDKNILLLTSCLNEFEKMCKEHACV